MGLGCWDDPALQAFALRLKKGAEKLSIPLSGDQVCLMTRHAAELMLWNKKINLTAIRDPLEMAEKHFVDAVAAASFLDFSNEGGGFRLLDLGSGGGFPGIPIKVMNPGIHLMLVDASRKKINFLKQVIRVLNLENADAVHARVEDLHCLKSFSGRWDAVISRGVARLSLFEELAAPLLNKGGTLYALKGKGGEKEITPALTQRYCVASNRYRLPFEKADRYVIRLEPLRAVTAFPTGRT